MQRAVQVVDTKQDIPNNSMQDTKDTRPLEQASLEAQTRLDHLPLAVLTSTPYLLSDCNLELSLASSVCQIWVEHYKLCRCADCCMCCRSREACARIPCQFPGSSTTKGLMAHTGVVL